MSEDLGLFIAAKRKSLGLSQLELSRKLGLHQTYLSKTESGAYVPSLKVLSSLSEIFGCAIGEMMALAPESKSCAISIKSLGLQTEYADIGPDEWDLIQGYRKLSPDVQSWLHTVITQ